MVRPYFIHSSWAALNSSFWFTLSAMRIRQPVWLERIWSCSWYLLPSMGEVKLTSRYLPWESCFRLFLSGLWGRSAKVWSMQEKARFCSVLWVLEEAGMK